MKPPTLLAVLCMVALTAGCSSRNPEALRDVSVSAKRSYPVAVVVTSAGDSVPVAPADYQVALVKTIENGLIFTGVKYGSSARLAVNLTAVDADSFGFTMKARTVTAWTFVDPSGQSRSTEIVGQSEKKFSDATFGPNRQREAIRGSMEDSIRKGLEWVSSQPDK